MFLQRFVKVKVKGDLDSVKPTTSTQDWLAFV
jgi:hypothetical protein